MSCLKRLRKEYRDILRAQQTSTPSGLGFIAAPNRDKEGNEDLMKWSCTILGPVGTPYEGGFFKVAVTFPKEYPFKPPSMKMMTKIYHPNINKCGHFSCCNFSCQWSPALTLAKTLKMMRAFLEDPNPNDPLVPSIALVYLKDKESFNDIAREWTKTLAGPTTEVEKKNAFDAHVDEALPVKQSKQEASKADKLDV